MLLLGDKGINKLTEEGGETIVLVFIRRVQMADRVA